MKLSKITACAALAAGLAGATAAARAAEYATVVSSTPVVQSVNVPRQECAEVEQVVRRQPSGVGALVGAIVGGVVGNQFGHGMGRAAATGLGAVGGSALGNHVETSHHGAETVASRHCRTVGAYESRVVGYDVVYDYHGQRYSTRLERDPGRRLAIDVRPAGPADDGYGSARPGRAVPPAYADTPRYVEPRYVEPRYVEPRYVEPRYVAPRYVEPRYVEPRYVEPRDVEPATIGYYEQAPQTYAPAPVYVDSPVRYIAPAVIGLGIGYWMGNRWHHGHRHHGGHWGHRGR